MGQFDLIYYFQQPAAYNARAISRFVNSLSENQGLKMSHEETIKQFGFHPSGSCDCGGVRNEKYRKGPFVIYIRKSKNLFKIKRNNEVVIPLTNLNVLEESLQKTFPQPVAG